MRSHVALWLLLAGCSPLAAAQAIPRHDCAALAKMTLPQARIVSAARVAAGAFSVPGAKPGTDIPQVFRTAPAFCRVAAVLTPSPDSDIKLEVWLPESGWSGRFRGQGNGGFAGYVDYGGLAAAVAQGYASASTDTGHSGSDAAWALGHPEKIIDFGWRAIHLMTVTAKAIVQTFYGEPARYAYFASCSNGGRQALMEAQRFPDDYDGIIAGAPAYDWTRLLTNALGVMQKADSVTGYIPSAKLPMIANAVLAACDANDGLVDGVLGDPPHCHFDPSVLRCKDRDTDSCLTAAQVTTLQTIYGGARDAAGKRVYYGTLPGAEDAPAGWAAWLFGSKPGANMLSFFVSNYFADMVYDDHDWNFRGVNLDAALATADRKTAVALNAIDANLQPFVSHGGKLILFHGWNDPAISPLGTVAYYDEVVAQLGAGQTHQSVRLYMVPGMLHCDGGTGAYAFGQNSTDARGDADHDIYVALRRWVEHADAPREIIASKYAGHGDAVEITRPLCPYPQTARYVGKGDKRRATSFVCAAEPPIRAEH